MRVKIFTGDDREKLEKEMNDWMDNKKIMCSDIYHIKQSESGWQCGDNNYWGITISVWYI